MLRAWGSDAKLLSLNRTPPTHPASVPLLLPPLPHLPLPLLPLLPCLPILNEKAKTCTARCEVRSSASLDSGLPRKQSTKTLQYADRPPRFQRFNASLVCALCSMAEKVRRSAHRTSQLSLHDRRDVHTGVRLSSDEACAGGVQEAQGRSGHLQ